MLNSHLRAKRYLFCSVLFSIALLYAMKGSAIPLSTSKEAVLFQAMEGKITYQGQPAAKAGIVVHLFWKDEVGEKTLFRTDENGEFTLPTRTARVSISPLAEFVITQQITVFFDNQEFVIWSKATLGIDQHSKFNSKLTNIRCELTDKRVKQESVEGLFSTSCKWDLIESGRIRREKLPP